MQKHKRKKFFIDRGVQGALARRLLFQWLLFFGVSFVVLPLWQLLLSGKLLAPFSEVMLDMWVESAPVFVILLLLLPMFVWDTITLSHRFAGPIYRLRGDIRRLAQGEKVRPLKFRDGDFWQEVADDFNLLLARLEAEESRQRPQVEAVSGQPSAVS